MPRPRLPLETQANIEAASEVFFASQPLEKLISLITNPHAFTGGGPPTPPRPQPARMKLAFREYATGLFDCEAQFYAKHAQSEAELYLWLAELSGCIVDDVGDAIDLRSRQAFSRFDFHCTSPERIGAIFDALEQRSEYWVKAARADPDVCAAWERSDPEARAIWDRSQPRPAETQTEQPPNDLLMPNEVVPEKPHALPASALVVPSKGPETRERRLQAFITEKKTSIAAVRRTARVAKPNMQQWRHGELSDDSVMSRRIEDALSGKTELDTKG